LIAITSDNIYICINHYTFIIVVQVLRSKHYHHRERERERASERSFTKRSSVSFLLNVITKIRNRERERENTFNSDYIG